MTQMQNKAESKIDNTKPSGVKIIPVGDQHLAAVFGDTIELAYHRRICSLCRALESQPIRGIREWVPTYGALLIGYDPELVLYSELKERLEPLLGLTDDDSSDESDLVTIPVCYGGAYGPDLDFVASHTGLDAEVVIHLHQKETYLIYMLGFTPGFPYLGGMDPALETPRLKVPRTKIPAGAVGIAGKQTGVYPSASPGGWQLIGQTPLKLFNLEKEQPFLLKAGQRLKFEAINEKTFLELAAKEAEICGTSAEQKGNEIKMEMEMGMGEKSASFKKKDKSIQLETVGPLTTLQDLGRWGYRQYGVSSGGAMDRHSARVANVLVGNSENASVLEMTYLGVGFTALKPLSIAVTGAIASFTINRKTEAMDRTHHLQAGDQVSIGSFTSGMRGYLAVGGGFLGDLVMGSQSTDLRGKFGGHEGRLLKPGDMLATGADWKAAEKEMETNTENQPSDALRPLLKSISPTLKQTINACGEAVVRVVLGPQAHLFTEGDLLKFEAAAYRVTQDLDRMGMRLDGETLSPLGGGDILSDGITAGAVQVPGHGSPIVMLADCQTTGGYAKIAQVITVDLPILAQLRPGDAVKFQRISLEEAQNLYLEDRHQELTAALDSADSVDLRDPADLRGSVEQRSSKQYQLTVEGKVYLVEVEEIF